MSYNRAIAFRQSTFVLSPSKHEWGDSFDGETNTCVAYLHFDKLSANGLPNLNAIALCRIIG